MIHPLTCFDKGTVVFYSALAGLWHIIVVNMSDYAIGQYHVCLIVCLPKTDNLNIAVISIDPCMLNAISDRGILVQKFSLPNCKFVACK